MCALHTFAALASSCFHSTSLIAVCFWILRSSELNSEILRMKSHGRSGSTRSCPIILLPLDALSCSVSHDKVMEPEINYLIEVIGPSSWKVMGELLESMTRTVFRSCNPTRPVTSREEGRAIGFSTPRPLKRF